MKLTPADVLSALALVVAVAQFLRQPPPPASPVKRQPTGRVLGYLLGRDRP